MAISRSLATTDGQAPHTRQTGRVTSQIGLTGVAISGLLVAVAVVVSLVRHLGLATDMITASARAFVQLALVGVALRLVVDDGDPIIYAWVWVAVMIAFAASTVRRRAPEVDGAFGLALVAFGGAAMVTLGVLFGLGVFDLTGRTLVPLSGMMIGNSMTAIVVASRRVITEASEHADLIQGRVALGATIDEALLPHVRASLRTALIPQIETTKAVGIVFLPGAMVGLILAGADPIDAVRVQTAVMYLVLGSVSTTTLMITFGVSRKLFPRVSRPGRRWRRSPQPGPLRPEASDRG